MEPREQLVDTGHLKPGPLSYGIGIGAAAVGMGFGVLLLCWGLSWLWPHGRRQEIGGANPARQHNASLAEGAVDQPKIGTPAIKRQVTEFRSIDHEAGEVTTGWQYADGRGGVPLLQYCYYTANVPGTKHKSDKIEIAVDGKALSDLDTTSVPDLEGAEAKCQWWTKEQIGVSSQDQASQVDQQHVNEP
jgi:hypothetical protein